MGFFRRWLQNDVKKMIEEAEEREKEQWRLYQEIKKEGWLKSENLDKLNPWRFSEEHINSMPEEEFDELCFRAAQKEKNGLLSGL